MSIVVNKTRLPVTEWQTESGSVVSISDARKRYAKSLSVALEPIQDLHGYSNPWVGGAGKNICPNTGWIQGQIQSNGNISPYNYSISSGYIYLTAGTYTAWRSYSGVAGQLAYHTYDLDKVHLSDSGWKTNPFAIVVTEPIYIRFTTMKDTITPLSPSDIDGSFKIQLEKGSTATAWTPYENLCPISGRSSVTAVRDGKNLCDEVFEDGYIKASGEAGTYANAIRSRNFNPCVPSESYYYKITSGISGVNIAWYDAEKNFIQRDNDKANTIITAPSNACFFKLSIYNYKTVNPTYSNDVSINYPSTATAYEPYQGISVTLSLGQTVYRGSVEVVSGAMVVTNVYKAFAVNDMNNSEAYPGWRGFGIRDIYGGNQQRAISYLCDSFRGKTVGINTMGANDILFLSTAQWGVTNQTEFKQVYGGLVFGMLLTLATPQTIQLSTNQIEMLMRNNTVWSDAGVVTLNYARIHQ